MQNKFNWMFYVSSSSSWHVVIYRPFICSFCVVFCIPHQWHHIHKIFHIALWAILNGAQTTHVSWLNDINYTYPQIKQLVTVSDISLGKLVGWHKSSILTATRVGFLPGRKVFLLHEGKKLGRKYFCCGFCRGETAETGQEPGSTLQNMVKYILIVSLCFVLWPVG